MSAGNSLPHVIRLMPKTELHVHLEGTLRPQTLLELAARHRVSLPADSVAGVRQWFRFEDFAHFVDIYLHCCRCLRDPEDFQRVAEEFLTDQARQNILYSEAHFTVGTHLANGVNGGEVAQALWETITNVEKRYGIKARLIPDIVRNVGVDRADQTLEWALDGRRYGVVALGLSGYESIPDDDFREHFRVAKKEGLGCVAHAGEHEGPETISSALDLCEAERIGHGIRALEDDDLIERLRDEQILLEICPTSNVCLGAVENLSSHPIERLESAAVPVTINSNDPALFDTSLSAEYLAVAEAFGWGIEKLAELSSRALRFAFLDDDSRASLEDEYDARFEELGIEYRVPRADTERLVDQQTKL